jgi:hypothetical protein
MHPVHKKHESWNEVVYSPTYSVEPSIQQLNFKGIESFSYVNNCRRQI